VTQVPFHFPSCIFYIALLERLAFLLALLTLLSQASLGRTLLCGVLCCAAECNGEPHGSLALLSAIWAFVLLVSALSI
jgi:hypothetical protein